MKKYGGFFKQLNFKPLHHFQKEFTLIFTYRTLKTNLGTSNEMSVTFNTDFELTFLFSMKIKRQCATIDTGVQSIDWIFSCSKNRPHAD